MLIRTMMTKRVLNGGTTAQRTGHSYSKMPTLLQASSLVQTGQNALSIGICALIRALRVLATSLSTSHSSTHDVETVVRFIYHHHHFILLTPVIVLKALVRASGDLGLSALLPSPDRRYRPQTQGSPITDIPPHLPLSSEWEHVDFSLAAVFASGFWTSENGINLREWVQRMLERYRHVIGKDRLNKFDKPALMSSTHPSRYGEHLLRDSRSNRRRNCVRLCR
jgi:hypothetical protein